MSFNNISQKIFYAFVTAGLLWSPLGWSWPDQYDGSVIDINQIHAPAERYPYCDRYEHQGSSDPRENNLQAYKACERGTTEARRMAERFGQGNGEVLGLLMGYTRGLFNAFEGSKDKDEYVKLGEQGVTGDFQRAKGDGIKAASGEAKTMAQSDVIALFRQAVEDAQEPKPVYDERSVLEVINRYAGVPDGYSKSGFGMKDEQTLLREATANLGQTPIFHDVNSTTFDGLGNISFWDLYTKRGEARSFAEYGWGNSRRAWSVWQTLPDVAKAEYDNLRESYVMVEEVSEHVDPATGKVVREIRQVKKVIFTRDVVQRIWADGFMGSYEFYVSHYFSLAYHQNIQRGYGLGLALGTETGKIYAMQVGKVREFNRRYQEVSRDSYRETFRGEYDGNFHSTFEDYMSHPKLEINKVTFIGKTEEDGIFTPGEWIRSQALVTNLGGVGKDVKVRLVGDIEAGSDTEENKNVPRISRQMLETDFIARIDTRLQAREQANIGVSVDGLGLYNRFEVNKIAEVDNVVLSSLDVVRGSGQLRIYLSNPSKNPTPSSLILRVEIPEIDVIERNLPPLEAGTKKKPVDISFSGLDPLHLIDKGTFNIRAVLVMGDEEMHSGSDSVTIDRSSSLASYFHALVNQQVEGLSQSETEIRLGAVQDRVLAIAQDEVNKYHNSSVWENRPADTMAGQLAQKYKTQAFSSDPQVKGRAQAQYQDLGETLWKLRGKIDKGSTRKAYSQVIMEFSPEIHKKKLKK